MDEHSDFILTRILWLDGLEPHNANTRSRYIYIHGTNKKLSQRGKNFQELKICGHGTILALTKTHTF